MPGDDYWLGNDAITIILSTLIFLPLAIISVIVSSSIPTFVMNRKRILFRFQFLSTFMFIVYFVTCISFLVGVLNAQIESKTNALQWNSLAVFCFSLGKIFLYCFFIVRLRSMQFVRARIFPISQFSSVILILPVLFVFIVITPYVIGIVIKITYETQVVIAYIIQFVVDIFFLQQFCSRLFKVCISFFLCFCDIIIVIIVITVYRLLECKTIDNTGNQVILQKLQVVKK